MDFSQLLNQVLGAAQKGGKAVADSPLNSFGGGALTGALASMLLKKKNTKKLVKAGSVAALGFLAYKRLSKLETKPPTGRIAAKCVPTCRPDW